MKIIDKISRPSEFRVRLKEAMTVQGKSQADLVKLTGIPKSAMSQYVNGNFEPKHDRLEKLARALEVSESWLLGYDTPMRRPYDYSNLEEGPYGSMMLINESPYEEDMMTYFATLNPDEQHTELMRVKDISNGKKPSVSDDEELSEYLEKLRVDENYRMMFSLMNGATKEDVAKAVQVVKALLGEE